LTARELLCATKAKINGSWQHTASLMAMQANCHRDPKRKAYSPEDFMPKPPRKETVMPADIGVLKMLLPRKANR